MGINHLVFDTTDAASIADSHHVGAHTLSGTGNLITSGDGNSDNIVNTAIEGLDSRSFLFGYDAVGANWDRIQQVAGAVKVYIDDGDFEVDVVINAEKAEDSAHSSAAIGNFVLGVRIEDITANNSALLAGTNGDYQGFFTNSKGELYVKDTDVKSVLDTIKTDTAAIVVDVAAIEVELLDQGTTLDSILVDTLAIKTEIQNLSQAEDAVHSSGDLGIQALSVRINDLDAAPVGTLAGAEGDYQALHTSARGALYVKHDGDIVINDAALANVAISHAKETAAVSDTAESAVTSVLSNRKYLFLANEANKKAAIGGAGVTLATGFPIYPGSYLSLRAGASVNVQWAATDAASSDLRILQLS